MYFFLFYKAFSAYCSLPGKLVAGFITSSEFSTRYQVCIINEYYLLYFNLGIQKKKHQISKTLPLEIKMYKSMHDEYLVCSRLP